MTPLHARRRAVRTLAAVTAGALASGALTMGVASAAIPTDDACPSYIPEDHLTDTGPEGDPVEQAVDCLRAYAITQGQTATTYGTANLVTRAQLATFMLNILDLVEGFTPVADAPTAFPDLGTGDAHTENINQAAALGLVQGFTDGTFRPSQPVSRNQMASYIVRALEAADVAMPLGTDAFEDDDGDVHEPRINALHALEIVEGDVHGDYLPARAVSRGNMAFFLSRTLEVLVDLGLVEPFPAPGPILGDARGFDVGVVGLVDAGDVHQLAFSEPMAATVDDDGQGYRISDADGTVADVTCAVNATCVLQGAGMFNGSEHAAGQVLRIFVVGQIVPLTGASGTVPDVQYPATITNVSAGYANPAGEQLVMDRRADDVLDVAPIEPTIVPGDVAGPNMLSAIADESDSRVVITFTEPVLCEATPAVAAAFSYADANDEDAPALQVSCDGTALVVVTFAAGVVQVVDATGVQRVRYVDDGVAVDTSDVRDVNGNQANMTDAIRPIVQT